MVNTPTTDFTWAHINDQTERVTITAHGSDTDCDDTPGNIDWSLTEWTSDSGEMTDATGQVAQWKATSKVTGVVKCKLDDGWADASYDDAKTDWSDPVDVKGYYVGVRMQVTKPDGSSPVDTIWETDAAGATTWSNCGFTTEWLESECAATPRTRTGNVTSTAEWTYLTDPDASSGVSIQKNIKATLGHSFEGGVDMQIIDEDGLQTATASATINLGPLSLVLTTTAPGICDIGAAIAAGYEGQNYLGGSTNATIQANDTRYSSVVVPTMNPQSVSPSGKPGLIEKGKWKIEGKVTIKEVTLIDDVYGWVKSNIRDTSSVGIPAYVP